MNVCIYLFGFALKVRTKYVEIDSINRRFKALALHCLHNLFLAIPPQFCMVDLQNLMT